MELVNEMKDFKIKLFKSNIKGNSFKLWKCLRN